MLVLQHLNGQGGYVLVCPCFVSQGTGVIRVHIAVCAADWTSSDQRLSTGHDTIVIQT